VIYATFNGSGTNLPLDRSSAHIDEALAELGRSAVDLPACLCFCGEIALAVGGKRIGNSILGHAATLTAFGSEFDVARLGFNR
jgi:hypothetical protein